MIKDFIPARTSLASGLVVKQHLLERNKYKQPTVQSPINELLTGSIQSKQIWVESMSGSMMSSSLIESFSGGAAGMFNSFNNEYELSISSSIINVPISTNVSGSIPPEVLSYVPSAQPLPEEGKLYLRFASDAQANMISNVANANTFFNRSNLGNPMARLVAYNSADVVNNTPTSSPLATIFVDNENRPIISPKIFALNTTDSGGRAVAELIAGGELYSGITTTGTDMLLNNQLFFMVFPGSVPFDESLYEFSGSSAFLPTNIKDNNFFPSSSLSASTVLNDIIVYPTPPQFNVTQSFTITTPSLSGSITRTHRSQDEFYNGELSGSTLIISNGELNEDCAQFKFINPKGANYGIRSYNSVDDNFGDFINSNQKPLKGFIQLWFQDDASAALPAPNPSL
jgi:hypothetical protein